MARKPKAVMVAVDNSDYGLHALQYAAENLVGASDSLIIVHVRPQVEEKDFFAAEPYRVEFEEAYLRDSEELLEKMKKLAASILPAGVGIETVSLAGDPSEELLKVAEKIKPGMLVVGSHGKGFLKRALLGSVSRYLVHTAPCPVLVVKGAPQSTAASLVPGLEQLGKVVASAS